MSARTAPLHRADELRFLDACDRTNIVHFQSDSRHAAARTNTTGLDVLTGATYCDCKAGECHKVCWHLAAVIAAWDAEPARCEVAWLTDAQLVRYGTKAAAMLAVYRARTGRVLPMDQINVVAARAEYRLRQAHIAAPRAA
jgi:hypothetical protein